MFYLQKEKLFGMSNTRICDICDREAAWVGDYSAYCKQHAPIPTPMKETRAKKRTQKKMRRPDLADDGMDADAAFLLDLAGILRKREATVDIAKRLKQIAERLQAPLDEDRERRAYLRREKGYKAPKLDKVEIETALAGSENYVGRLNAIGQQVGVMPAYHFVKTGADHAPVFVCTVTFQANGTTEKAQAQAGSKKDAKQQAALQALKMLRERSAVSV